jgi:uncharacterized protein (TIGR02284 family)
MWHKFFNVLDGKRRFMETKEAINEVLNDLVKINNDRISAYDRAIAESKDLDIDLKALFEQMANQSKQYKDELSKLINEDEGFVEDDTTSAGKIYRAWMDIKKTFTESDRLSILASCEFTEDAAQRAYDAALAQDCMLDESVRKVVEYQQSALKKSHEIIKAQRDAHKSLQK